MSQLVRRESTLLRCPRSLPHLHSLSVQMSQESSAIQPRQSVPWALMPYAHRGLAVLAAMADPVFSNVRLYGLWCRSHRALATLFDQRHPLRALVNGARPRQGLPRTSIAAGGLRLRAVDTLTKPCSFVFDRKRCQHVAAGSSLSRWIAAFGGAYAYHRPGHGDLGQLKCDGAACRKIRAPILLSLSRSGLRPLDRRLGWPTLAKQSGQ